MQAHLDPAHVVPIRDLFDVNGVPALLMDYVDGCSLSELLQARRLPEVEVRALLTDIVRGLREAHRAGIVHRDLKPGNVLVEVRGGRVTARVTDFGVATESAAPDAHVSWFVGTPAYASPEQLAGAPVDARSDLWAFGVLTYEMLAGERPYPSGRSLAELQTAQRVTALDLDALPAGWGALVDRLLQRDPEDRLGSCDAVLGELGPAAAPIRVPAPLAGWILSQRTEPVEIDHAPPSWAPPPLPGAPSAFVPRPLELPALCEHLAEARLVSVVGLGGVGKTRLVLEAARLTQSGWPGGVWFCDLREVHTREGLLGAVGRLFDLSLAPDRADWLAHALRARGRCLIVLDNFEQLVPVAADAVGAWVQGTTEAVFVLTSQRPLDLPGELVHPLGPMRPDEAEQLLLGRASSGFDASHREGDRAAARRAPARDRARGPEAGDAHGRGPALPPARRCPLAAPARRGAPCGARGGAPVELVSPHARRAARARPAGHVRGALPVRGCRGGGAA